MNAAYVCPLYAQPTRIELIEQAMVWSLDPFLSYLPFCLSRDFITRPSFMASGQRSGLPPAAPG